MSQKEFHNSLNEMNTNNEKNKNNEVLILSEEELLSIVGGLADPNKFGFPPPCDPDLNEPHLP